LVQVEAEKVKVEAEKKRADEEKQIAQAVNDFLQKKLLSQADTTAQANALLKAGELSSEAKRNPTIRELLDRAAKEMAPDKIEANFPNQPLVQAQILQTVGAAYRGVGEVGEGIPFLTRSLDLFKSTLSPGHADTLECMINLAQSYGSAGRWDKALALYEETLKLTKANLGPDHLHTLKTMGSLALCYKTMGKLDLAVPLYEEALKLKKAKLGPNHNETLIGMLNLGVSYGAAGKSDKALLLLQETLKLTKANLGPDHPHTLMTMYHLAGNYGITGRFDRSIPLFEETLTLQQAKLGPHHPNTLSSMSSLAEMYRGAGNLHLAVPLFEETLKLMKAKLGPEHPNTLMNMNKLAGCYAVAGKMELALPLWEDLSRSQADGTFGSLNLAALQAWFGKDKEYAATVSRVLHSAKGTQDPATAERTAKLCSLRPGGNEDERAAAVTLARRAVDLGQKHPALAYFQMALGMAQYRSGSFDEAQMSLAPLLDSQKKNLHIVGTAGFFQAMTLFRQGRTGEGTHRATITTQGMKPLPLDDRNPFADSANADDVIVWLAYKEAKQLIGFDATPDRSGQLAKHGLDLLKQRKWAEVEPLLRECLAIREKKEPDAWSTLNTQSMLGGALLGQKKYAEAEPLLLAGHEGMKAREKTIPPQANARIPESIDRLIELYTATNKPNEVKKWRAERAKYPSVVEVAPQPREAK
jgi:tetratricopeptide (TPR) repeat protein